MVIRTWENKGDWLTGVPFTVKISSVTENVTDFIDYQTQA